MAHFNFGTGQGSSTASKQIDLSAQCNGINQTFTVSENFVASSLRVYWNGIRQTPATGVSVESASTFSTTFTPESSDSLIIDYIPS
jgi:hypothetical protein